jgi:hypothetical protein
MDAIPETREGRRPRALAGFTVTSPQAGPLFRVTPAPAPRFGAHTS